MNELQTCICHYFSACLLPLKPNSPFYVIPFLIPLFLPTTRAIMIIKRVFSWVKNSCNVDKIYQDSTINHSGVGLGITIRCYHNILPAIMIISRYIHDNCKTFNPRYIMISVSLKKFRIFGCTESISQELQNIVNQFHMNDSQVKQSVYCTVALLNTHTDRNLNIIKYRYLAPV